MTSESVYDSPTSWVSQHIHEYVESNGEKGHDWQGVPTLLITTAGRKTGKLRRSALIYGRNAEDYVIVASRGGAPEHPAWYLNLTSNPEVELQVGSEVFKAKARTASDDEKPALWEKMAEIWPDYNEYQKKTDRPIPVVVLEPV